ncbi:protein artemis isoform X10 [Hippocampus comes]|uniref:protein artemis isoform X10 n=1 Tax=Hippocampus comes TaxID=109280 RepID=UPI00094ED951|nr:PREDICTED: protein artemis-like isoform X10 [Hippocampus comes]
MSSFPGRMKEYPYISLDRFDHENLHARAYFLSHCHKDHMRGIKAPKLKRRLRSSRRVKLYCSLVTKELLLSSRKHLFWEKFIVPLELESPTQISLVDEASGESEEVVVTLLPAGHCPGSVMFLFEGCHGNVLYTGDFRLALGDAARMEHLHSGSRVKDIRSVYVDSTFFDPRFYQIPSREACVSAVLRLAGDWIARSALHVVWLNCKAAYGYEYLFTRLGREFNTRVKTPPRHSADISPPLRRAGARQQPADVPEDAGDPELRDHRASDADSRLPTPEERAVSPRQPAAVRLPVPRRRQPARAQRQAHHHVVWGEDAQDRRGHQVMSGPPRPPAGTPRSSSFGFCRSGSDAFRACFSFHSSYCEVKDFLSYLRPARVFANVVPMGRTLAEVTRMLQTTCRKRPRDDSAYKPLGLLKGRRAAPTPPRGETRTSDTRATSKSAQPKLARHKEGRPQDMLERSRAPDTPQRRAPPKHTPQTGAAASRRRASKAPPHKSTFKTTSLTLIFVPSDWESDDDLFDSSPPKKKPRERRRVPDERRGQTPAPPTPEEDSPQPVTCDANHEERIDNNFLDCTESNDDDSEEGGQSEEDEQSEGDESATKWRGQTGSVAGEPPKWEDFFTAEPLPDSQKSLNSQSPPGWRTPEASSEREDDVDHVDDDFSLSLSASASNHSSQNRDAAAGDAPSEADEPTPPSLDFDIPCTPDSKRPTPEQLTGLYRKLARGDDLSSPD